MPKPNWSAPSTRDFAGVLNIDLGPDTRLTASSRAVSLRRQFVLVGSCVVFGQLGYYLTTSGLSLYLAHLGTPEHRIGLDIGIGSIASLATALIVGPLINRNGPRPFLILGCGAYLAAALVMLVVPFEAAVITGRLLQGLGVAMTGPSALAAVPMLAPKRSGSAIGLMSSLSTLPLAVGPPVGLAIYTAGGSKPFLLASLVVALCGLLLGLTVSLPVEPERIRASGLGYDRAWTPLLLANLVNGIYFGGLLAYLPLFLVSVHGPNAGIFFTADAVGVFLFRFPSGFFADRAPPAWLMLSGFLITMLALAAFLLPPGIVWLVLAGAGTGIGTGLFAGAMLTVLLGAASPSNRGTATTLTVVSVSLGIFAGSSVSGLLYGPAGFSAVVVFGIIAEGLGVPFILIASRRRGAMSR